ncbi:hypothetical protein KIL84_001106 [Mauremys mutica]|uniref:Uncharacterized protein n=1 Tax=Mauremys mutica TaxID=74926 RepID=A0A9D3WYI2_9SAUR|nr:hypothetical protein KIL84_001106 [Mauremys mutica]
MAHAAASIKKVREAELDERERNLEKERKKQRKIPRERVDRKRKPMSHSVLDLSTEESRGVEDFERSSKLCMFIFRRFQQILLSLLAQEAMQ